MASERSSFNDEEGGSGGGRSNRSGGRRNNGKGPKRPPQRGLGVEQLERLRMEESLKKAAEASGIPNFHHHDHQHHSQFLQFYPQQVYGGGSVPMRYGAGAPSSSGWLAPSYIEQQCRLPISCFGSGPLVRNPFETSKELSSMPNHHSLHFDNLCLKKTRLYDENAHGSSSNARRDHRPFHDFFGSVPQPAAAASSYATPKPDHEGVEVVAVHRRGDSGSGKVFMEYEFFPGKYGRLGTSIKELVEFPTIGSVEEVGGSGGSEGSSSITFAAYGDATTASNSLDLSLKL